MIEFQANDKTVNAYLATPKHGNGPGVLVLHAWWGLTPVFKQVCDRLAEEGFVALAPDLYKGRTTTSVDEAEQLSGQVESEEASQIITTAIDYLLNYPGLRGTTLGVVGFSLGAYFALGLQDHVAAIVTFYGTNSPDRVKGNILGHFAEHDDFEPVEQVRQFEEALHASGQQASFFIYPGTQHWFFEENRPEYDPQAAELAWERTVNFLRQRLSPEG